MGLSLPPVSGSEAISSRTVVPVLPDSGVAPTLTAVGPVRVGWKFVSGRSIGNEKGASLNVKSSVSASTDGDGV